MKIKLFAQIRKVDEEQRLVYGRAADETPDKSGEVLNYDGSKPHFIKWSEEMSKDTDGKSLGNVRAMHGKVAAGKLTDISFDDAAHTIDVCAKVVDEAEWKKVLEGVYTGFSIGGSYGAKSVEKVDGKELTRYIAIPNEISLVDRPCIPTAKFFQVQKVDGSVDEVEFKEAEVDANLTKIDTKSEEYKAAVQLGKADGKNIIKMDDVEFFNSEADAIEYMAKVSESATIVAEDETEVVIEKLDSIEDVEVSGSPEEIIAFGKLMNDENLSMAEVIALVKASKAEPEKTEETVAKVLTPSELRKGLYACSQFAQLIQALKSLQESSEWESYQEGDASSVPARLNACVALCGAVLKEMVDEELAELNEGNEVGKGDQAGLQVPIEMAEKCGEIAKADADPLMTLFKVGARNSVPDAARIKAIHDAAVGLGADCGTADKSDAANDLAKFEKDTLEKALATAIEPLNKMLAEANDKIAKLEAQPATPRVSLRAVSKAEDGGQIIKQATEEDLVKDDHGVVHPAASLIKQAQENGGQPLLYRG